MSIRFLTSCCLTASVSADPTDLGGGVLIAHYVAELTLSETPPDPCLEYAPYAITYHSEQVNRVDTDTYALADWFIIAAWTETKQFCGVQFGFSGFDPGIFAFSEFGACFPATGGLEIPSTGWPGPNEGIAFVVTGDAWEGNYLPVYWFIGYAYGYSGPDVIQLIPDPTVADPFGGMGNCASPPEKWDAALGGMGINTDGTYVEPTGVIYDYVCCVDGDCIIVNSEDECMALGGEFMPDLDSCEPDPCLIEAVCCVLGDCIITTEEQCVAAGGEFHPEVGSCDPNPCENTPTDETSWGTIKALYR